LKQPCQAIAFFNRIIAIGANQCIFSWLCDNYLRMVIIASIARFAGPRSRSFVAINTAI
jgi:hypothetical protein